MKIIAGYLRGRMAMQTVGVLAVLVGLMQLLELLDVTSDVLERHLGFKGVARYAALRLPSELVVALPLATLLGAMTAFYGLARSREITALRAAGVSLSRMLWQLLPVACVLALLYVALTQLLVPVAEGRLAAWWESTTPAGDVPPEPTWAHTREGPVSFERRAQGGRHLQQLRIYLRDGNRLLSMRSMARSADWAGDHWELHDITDLTIDAGAATTSHAQTRSWHTNLRPEDVMRLGSAQPYLSSSMLADVIGGERVGTQPLSFYRTILARTYSAPFGILLMLLLSIPCATILFRSGAGGGALLWSLALGLSFLLCDGVAAALGTSGQIRPMAAALAAPLVFAAIGVVQLAVCERA